MSSREPYRWRGLWLWPIDGYYDVHPDEGGAPAAQPIAELLTLSQARALICEERRYLALLRLGGLAP